MNKQHDYFESRIRTNSSKDWPNKKELYSGWSNEEKERMIEALEALPDALLTQNLVGFLRMKKSKDHPNPASNAANYIAVYDSAFDESRNLARILAHELAHLKFDSLDEFQYFGLNVKVDMLPKMENLRLTRTTLIILSTFSSILIS